MESKRLLLSSYWRGEDSKRGVIMITLYSSVVLNIVDHVLRDLNGKFGGLLGITNPEGISFHNSFEIITDDTHQVDGVFLRSRLEQLQLVSPELTFKGLYYISKSDDDYHALKHVVERIKKFTSSYYNRDDNLAIVIVSESKLREAELNTSPFSCYSESLTDSLPMTIESSKTEQIVANTAINYKKYSSPKTKLNLNESNGELSNHVKDLSASVYHLRSKVVEIIDFMENNTVSYKSSEITKIEQELVYLANKVVSFKELNTNTDPTSQNLQVQTTHLSILINQINSLRNVNMNIQKHLSKTKMFPQVNNT